MTTIHLPLDAGYILLRRPQVGGVAAAALALAVRIAGWPARVIAARRTMRLLGAMNDRELADIGLARSDVRDATGLGLGDDPTSLLARRARERARRGA
jgi:uncharacterized protein YjiS (DUF1127 family)